MSELFSACIGACASLCVVSVCCLIADFFLPHDEDVHCRFGYVACGALFLALVPLSVMALLS